MSITKTTCGDTSYAQGLNLNSATGLLSIFPEGNEISLEPAVKLFETQTEISVFSLSGTTLTLTYIGENGIPDVKTVNLNALAASNYTAVGPISINVGTREISISQANAGTSGFLSNADWTTFNNKVNNTRNVFTTGPLVGGGNLSADRTISIPQADGATSGYLTSSDWTIFSAKLSPSRAVNTISSLAGGGDLSVDRNLSLVNDQLNPGASKYYGTDSGGTKGYHTLATTVSQIFYGNLDS